MPVEFRLIGSGQTFKETKKLSKQLGLRNIEFLPPIPIEELPYEISAADICLGGHFGLTEKAARVVPGKIYQILAMEKPIIAALLSAPLCSFLPGLGSGQSAIIGNTIIKNSRKQFMILLGITNTLVMSFSFISLYMIQKTRTGAALAIKEIIGNPESKHLILIIIIITKMSSCEQY